VLSDADGVVGRALGALRTIRLGAWTIEFLRRSTLLAGTDGRIARVWTDVKIRGHALQVLEAARALTGAP
jgi:thioredoxin-dependent peroxiredoxin